jgi:VWFA-related protein
MDARKTVILFLVLATLLFAVRAETQNFSDPGTAAKPAAQSPQQNSSPPLRAATRLVQVSIVVQDKHGNPVTGLTKDDFVLLDENKPQTIQVFSVQTNQVPASPPAALPPDVYTNRVQERAAVPTAITVILLDGLNTKFEDQTYARKQVVKFLQQIQPQDRIALYTLGSKLHVLQDFTSDSTSLLAAINQYSGRTPSELQTPSAEKMGSQMLEEFINSSYQAESTFYMKDRVQKTMAALTEIAAHVGTLPGRKNLIWVSGSFPILVGFDNIIAGPQNDVTPFGKDIEEAARALNDANLAVYPVDARGLMTFVMNSGPRSSSPNIGGDSLRYDQTARSRPTATSGIGTAAQAAITGSGSRMSGPDPASLTTLLTLADRTGGKAFYNTNDILGAIRQAVDDSRLTYEIGYYPEDIAWDGTFHRIQVQTKDKGGRVRARKGYFAMPEPQLTQERRQAIIARIATGPLDATGIGVKVRVRSTVTQPERKMKMMLYFNPHEFSFAQRDGRWEGIVDTVFVELDDKGQPVAAVDETLNLNFDDAKFNSLLKEGIRYEKQITIAPTTIEVRVLLRDVTNGNVGSIQIPLAKYFPLPKSTD